MRRQVKGYFSYSMMLLIGRYNRTPVAGTADVFNGHDMTMADALSTIMRHAMDVYARELKRLPIAFSCPWTFEEPLSYSIGSKEGTLAAASNYMGESITTLRRLAVEAELRKFNEAITASSVSWEFVADNLFPHVTEAMLAASIVCMRAGVPMDVIRLHLCPRIWACRHKDDWGH